MSRNRFRDAVTAVDWVSRPMDQPDYGIDEEVEIFESNRTTGLFFKVQLKAIETADSIGPAVTIKMEHFDYWGSLGVPVLLVLWVASEDELYAKWVHRFDFGQEASEAQTRRVRFAASDRLSLRIDSLSQEVALMRAVSAGGMPRPIPLSVSFEPEESANAFRYELRRYLLKCKLDHLVRVEPNDLEAVKVTVNQTGLRVALPVEIGSINLHVPPDYAPPAEWEAVICDILCSTAILCARQGATSDAMQLLNASFPKSRVPDGTPLSMELAELLYQERPTSLANVKLLEYYLSDQDVPEDLLDIYYSLTLSAAATLRTKELKQLTKAAWHRIEFLTTIGQQHDAARLAHNFANLLRVAGRWAKLEAMVDESTRLDPEAYGERSDTFVLRGDARWHLGDLNGCVEAYQRARDLGEPDSYIVAPLSDALFEAGRYRQAAELIDQLMAAGSEPDSRSIFRRMILGEVIEGLGVERQDRASLTDAEVGAITESGDRARVLDALRRSDALDLRLWVGLPTDADIQDGPSPLGLYILEGFRTNRPAAWVLAAFTGTLLKVDPIMLEPILDQAAMAEGALEIVQSLESLPSASDYAEVTSNLRSRILAHEPPLDEYPFRVNFVDEKNSVMASIGDFADF